jgi:hypothetical protein
MQARSREVACTLIALGIAFAAPLTAAETTGTEGPDIVQSTATAGRSTLRIGTSFARLRHLDASAKAPLFPTSTLLRYGLNDDLDFRLGDGRSLSRMSAREAVVYVEANETGVADPSAGVKVPVVEDDGLRVAVLVQGDVEAESRAVFKGEGVRPSLRGTLDWRLSDDVSLGATPGIVYDKTDGRRHASATLGIALGKAWTQRFQTYVEAAAERIASARNGGSTVTYNLGGAYLLRDTVQIDSALSWGPAGDTPDLSWTVGVSMKF